jgi:hypothetical protein
MYIEIMCITLSTVWLRPFIEARQKKKHFRIKLVAQLRSRNCIICSPNYYMWEMWRDNKTILECIVFIVLEKTTNNFIINIDIYS